jgi:epidermal growth factor receptor substrate 15
MINDWVYPLGGLFTVVGGIGLFLQMRRASEEQPVVILEEHTDADKAALEKSKTDLETRLSTSEEATQSYKQEALSLQGKVHHLEKDLAHFQKRLQEREDENSHLRQQAAQFKQSSESLHQQFSQLEVFHEQLKASHQREIQELQKSKDVLSLRLQQEMSKLADLRSQILGLEQNQKRQQQQAVRVQELEKSQQDWSAEKSTLMAEGQLQLKQVETLERALEQEQNAVKVLHTKIEPLQKTIAERESQYQAAIALTESLNLQVQTMETQKGEWQPLEVDLRQQLANLEDLEQQAKSQGEVLTAQVQTLEGQIQTLEESLEKDRQGFLQAQAQWESDRQGFLNAQAQWESDRQGFLQAQAQWESDRQGLEMVQKNQELAYQSLKSQFALLQQQWATLNEEKTQQESELELEQSKVADLERQLLELQVSIILADDDDESEEIQEEEEPSTLPNDELENEPILLAETVTERETPVATDSVATDSEIVTEVSPVATLETSEPSPETQTATPPETVPTETSLIGKKFIILGTLNQINRDRAKDLIQTAGGTLMSSPSAKTDYALVGKSPGEKLKKVQKLGISQLSESQFLKLLGIES